MSSEIKHAMRVICEQKGISYESVLEAIETALAAAYKKDFGAKNQNIKTEFNPETGGIRVFDAKVVVEDQELTEEELAGEAEIPPVVEGEDAPHQFDPKEEIMISDARMIKPSVELGEEIRMELELPSAFGRMAAQTAKQVILQKLRESERQVIFSEFKDKEGTVMVGSISRKEGKNTFVEFGGNASAFFPVSEQIPGEAYRPGSRFKFFVKSVGMGPRGPEIVVSRADGALMRELFAFEVPEVNHGIVEIRAVAREAGSRAKVAVYTERSEIDPVGSCIGQRGSRIQTIINELAGEKIDIIEWSENPAEFIAQALSPARVLNVQLDDEHKTATVDVAPAELSLAIGKAGQNVRLASQLTGWKISIKGADMFDDTAEQSMPLIVDDAAEQEDRQAVLAQTLGSASGESTPAPEAPVSEPTQEQVQE